MKYAVTSTVILGLLSFESAATTTVSVSYDQVYDNGSNSLDTVACSNGVNGLETAGFSTFESLPNFPFIGGAAAVGGWDSSACGTCWQLTYQNRTASKSIFITAIDVSGPGEFNIELTAMNALTNNDAVQLGRVSATAQQVNTSECGF